MSKRISSKDGTYCPQKASEHMKKYISENNLSDEKMAWICDRMDRRTISAIRTGKDKVFCIATFETIAKCTKAGYPVDYWTGMTDSTDCSEYEREKRERILAEQGMEELEKRIANEHRQKVQQYKSFFSVCGYRYDDISDINDPVTYDEELGGKPHLLTKYGSNDEFSLSNSEFQELLSKLTDTIDFVRFKTKERGSI